MRFQREIDEMEGQAEWRLLTIPGIHSQLLVGGKLGARHRARVRFPGFGGVICFSRREKELS
jgi:hypothetical protein